MATVTEPVRTHNLGEAHRKVRHPLQRLRGYIRWFVITEALIVLVSCLAAAFWLGVGIDFFFHKVLAFDLVMDAPLWVRSVLLGTALLGVAFLVDLRKAMQIRVDPERERNRGASAFLVWLAQNPWCLAVFAVVFVGIYYTLWCVIALARGDGGLNSLGVGLIVAGILGLFTALIVVKRLLYEFRDPALAMVLERRYPQLLGDRLITAVELHDPKEAEQLGYSPAMLENTILEASDRVDQIHLGEVFRWKRLWYHGALALFLTVGIYLLSWGTAATVAAIREKPVGARQFHELNNVALTSFERLVLLEDEPWPPEMLPPILLEAVDEAKEDSEREFVINTKTKFSVPAWDEEDERTGKLEIYAVFFEMAIHDAAAPLRWRPMLLSDVRKIDDSLSNAPTAGDLPKHWRPRVPQFGWTIDNIRTTVRRVTKGEVPEADRDVVEKLKEMLSRLDKLADDPSMHRKMQKMPIPAPVQIEFEQAASNSNIDVKDLGGASEPELIYKGTFTKLDQPGTFILKAGQDVERLAPEERARAAKQTAAEQLARKLHRRRPGYVSDEYEIGIIPPPGISKVFVDEEVPAYLRGYLDTPARPYEAGDWAQAMKADDDLLRGKRQKLERRQLNMRDVAVPQHNSPAGSTVTFRLEANVVISQKLKPIVCKVRDLQLNEDRTLKDVNASDPVLSEDGKTIILVVSNVRGQTSFTFDFWDARGAKGKQEVQLLTTPDGAPVVSKADPEIIRKDETEMYFVRVGAVIPFLFNISDDHGIASIKFTYTIEEKLTAIEEAQRPASVAAGLGLTLSGPEGPFSSIFQHHIVTPALLAQRKKATGSAEVPHFVQQVNLRREQVKELLNGRPLAAVLAEPAKSSQKAQMVNRYLLPDLKSLDKYLNISDFDKTSIDGSRPLKGFDIDAIRWEGEDEKGQKRELRLKAGDGEYQKQYVMYVTVEVKDTNVERPGRGHTPYTRTFTVNIVRDEKLTELISKEEKALYDELSKMLDELRKAREELVRLRFDLPSAAPAGTAAQPVDFLSYSVRAEGVEKAIREGMRVTAKVQSDYERIVLEYRTNRLEERAKNTFNQVTTPLDLIRNGAYPWEELGADGKKVTYKVGLPNAQDEVSRVRRICDDTSPTKTAQVKLDLARDQAAAAEKELTRTIAALDRTLAQMQGLVSWDKLIAELGKIEQAEHEALQRVKAQIKLIEDRLFESLNKP